jgi:oxalate decarboxylase family bicupin protein
VTVEDFPISKDIAGVNMRLTAGGIRELHWHNAAEWALMLTGAARITAIDNDGKSFVKDVRPRDLWFFPTGTPHSIQGLAPDGCEFLLVFGDGKFFRKQHHTHLGLGSTSRRRAFRFLSLEYLGFENIPPQAARFQEL